MIETPEINRLMHFALFYFRHAMKKKYTFA